ncbi:HAD-IA family hydrolase, partial [bacterium]|nr:HAD-IA family hydrolase [bacterium]
MTKQITVVFFDFGGTLCDYVPSNAEIWARIANRLGVQISPGDPCIRQGIRRQARAFEKLAIPFWQLSKEQLHNLNCCVLGAMGIATEGTQKIIEAEFFSREQEIAYTWYPDTLNTLRALQQKGIKTGLISNVDSRTALTRRPFLKETGILHYFETIILSTEVDVWKPNKEIFDIALREIGEKNPANALHIGDNPIADVRGAKNAGLIPILFDPLDQYVTKDVIKLKTLSDT